MSKAKKGDTVRVHYTGKFDNGTIFDTSKESGEPLQFTVGDDEIINGFSVGVVGMTPGQEKTILVKSTEAYGPHVKELVTDIDRMHLPEEMQIEIGQQLEISDKDETEPVIVTITHVSKENVTVDGNHPLAGKDLTFDIELVEITE
jgi:peptidylprolyl isomerase